MSLKFLIALAALAACALLAPDAACFGQASPGGDGAQAPRGKRLFLRCASCHDISGSGVARIGPSLKGVVGRKAGSLPGYGYSPAMKSADFVWDETSLNAWLTDPAALVPGTSMAFAGLPQPEDRAAIIAYLRQPEH